MDILDSEGDHFRDAQHHTPEAVVTGTPSEEVVAT